MSPIQGENDFPSRIDFLSKKVPMSDPQEENKDETGMNAQDVAQLGNCDSN
jgi:hypothetical protein